MIQWLLLKIFIAFLLDRTENFQFSSSPNRGFILKFEEEESTALLLHLLRLKAKDCFSESATGKRCCLVVALAQAAIPASG
jgi:hypothetical protein